MHASLFDLIYFGYGLAFFSMGLAIVMEVGRCSDPRLRHALWYLAAFGFLHGAHEWIEMFSDLQVLPFEQDWAQSWQIFRLVILAFSFLVLGTFGVLLLAPDERYRRLSLMVPLCLSGVWSFGLLAIAGRYSIPGALGNVIDVWTRYVLAIPGAILACCGLVFQQREFRRVGMSQFGRDTLWAAIAFAWYGLVGQAFTRPSLLPPSTFLNTELFIDLFGFPVQLLRAGAAVVAAFFVVRFLRSFEVETQRKLAELQTARLEVAQRREMVYSELLRRVVAAQEAERQRVARELHDETGQALTAIGLGLRGVTNLLRQDSNRAASNLRQLETLVARSLDELQRLIADLRPSHLDDLGLPAALRWYCNEIQNRAKIQINVEITGEHRELPAEMKTALFRVAQEALTNVVKHARATCASVRLAYDIDAVILEVEDNGVGFDPKIMKSSARPSWGLLGMDERTSLLGGKLTIRSEPEHGALICMVIPYFHMDEVKDGHTPGIGG